MAIGSVGPESKGGSMTEPTSLRSLLPLETTHASSCLGEPSAAEEWVDPTHAARVFLHTKSYDRVTQPDALFIFGRRGTGKTALLRMLQYEIRERKVNEYSAAWVIDEEDAYRQLALNIRMSPLASLPEDELKHVINSQWEWLINVSAMCAVVWQAQHDERLRGEQAKREKRMREYLAQQGILGDEQGLHLLLRPVQVVTETIQREFGELLPDAAAKAVRVANAALALMQRLVTNDYRAALQALQLFLAEAAAPALVLVDSIDEYNLDDDVSRAVASSLIETTERYYRERTSRRVLVKAAFPSEIYSHIRFPNAEKTLPRIHFILWRFQDLVCLLAKRYAHYIKHDEQGNLDVYKHAREYLGVLLPAVIRTRQGLEFDTLAYVLRHTQKKPRQAITMFNVVLTLAEENGTDPTNLPPSGIVEGVHRGLYLLTEGVFQVFDRIYPKASHLIPATLNGAPSFFDNQALDKYLKNTSSIRRDLGREDVKRLLFQAGVLGIVADRSSLPGGVEFWQVVFEYQVPRILTAGPDDTFAVHPMFYEHLQTQVSKNVFIYPVATESTERAILRDAGMEKLSTWS